MTNGDREVVVAAPSCRNGHGILITHGTDTMPWCLSALRYMLQNINCNIAITGSQKPMIVEYSSSDGGENIKNALLFLNRIEPPHIVVIFDYGRSVFGSKLEKFDKWDPAAFLGEEIAKISWDEIDLLGNEVKLKSPMVPLDKLYLLRTGGTIESTRGETGGLVPEADFVSRFLEQAEQRKYFGELESTSIVKKDSSDMNLDDWISIGKEIDTICNKYKKGNYCDDRFERNVKLITINPMFSQSDYNKLLNMATGGIVISGYGAGNVNTTEQKYSLIPMITNAKEQGKMVVLTSQVMKGVTDFEYETGLTPILMGAIPSGDLPPTECVMKLSYILGHEKEINTLAKKHKLIPSYLKESAFLAGINFRTTKSKDRFIKIRDNQIVILDFNPFINTSFENAMNLVARKLKDKQGKKLNVHDKYNDILTSFERMGCNLEKIREFIFDSQLFIAHYSNYEEIDYVRLMLARSFIRLQGKWDAEFVLNNIKHHSKYYRKAREILLDLQKDSDEDGWCDAIEKELGTDPYDMNSNPGKISKDGE